MMIKILPLMIISMSTTLSMISNPLSLGVYILMMTVMISMLMSVSTSSWLAMAMFLIYIGGLLVLFSYFMAIQPNQMISILSFLMISFFSMITFWLSMNNFYFDSMLKFNNKISTIPFIMFNVNTSFIIIISLILLLILIIVVKITTKISGPLRPFK